MPGQYITYDTVNVYKRARDAGCTQSVSAHIANISERSGSRIEQGEHQVKSKGDRGWRTRVDPLAEVWEKELEPMLQREPRLEATTLYEYLEERYPGQYESTLRTVQRRVQAWKAAHGAPQEVMFELHHAPGVVGHSDFTEVKQVSITIGGQPFEHLLYHYRLAYSGWQYVQVIQGGESFVALSEGLQNALQACGGVPTQHRTDSLSAAYRNGGGQRKPLTQFYQDLCQHYGLQPTRNNTGIAHENGSIESSHGYFKRRLRQALYLRGSTDFESVAAYQTFIETLISRLNAKCAEAFSHEQAHLQPLPTYRYADYETLTVRVSCHSTISVRCILYSVPSRLVGRQLTVHLYHDRLVGYVGSQVVVELPRLRVSTSAPSRRARCINYRHVIESLRRKPRAFLHCRWQQELLPNDHWRQLWQDIGTQFDLESAGRLMVEALYLAATQDKETAVADYLEAQLQQQTLTLAGLQKHFQLLQPVAVPALDGSNTRYHPMTNSSPTPNSTPSLNPNPRSNPTLNPLASRLNPLLQHLRLSRMRHHWSDLEQQATQHHWSYAQFLLALCELEVDHREQNRIKRALSEAKLPTGKSFSSFNFDHCPQLNPTPLMQLAQDPAWLGRAENLLIFGPSGTGKTHLAAALGRAAIDQGKRVRFSSATTLVQELQQAKAQLLLPIALTKLDRFDLLIVDDLGYVKKSEAETSVLFELIAHRYERNSLLITANQPFSQWDDIFADAMMTVAAVDRLVHHALIVDIKADSFRQQAALKRTQAS